MKKALALILALAMVFALSACTASLDEETLARIDSISDRLDAIEAQLAGDTAEETEEETEPAEEAVEVTNHETLPIGLMVNTTGWFAGVDTPNFNEFNAMVEYINRNGGWTVGDTNYTLEPVCVDGQSDYPALRTAAMSLVDAGVSFVVETNDFWVNSCADVFEEEGIMHASAYCVGSNTNYLIEDNALAFTGSNGSLGDMQACFAIFKEYYPDVHTVAYCNDDNGSTDETYEELVKMAEENGFEMVGSVIYPGETTDYTSYAQQLVDTGADAFMGNGSPDAYGAVLKAVRALGDDMVMGCVQGKPVAMVMEYAGADASYNGFTIGASTRESDAERNTDVFNGLVEVVGELYGEDAVSTFDGAAANTLYIMLQMMQKAGSIDPEEVAAAWTAGGDVETIYGHATVGGTETYGVENHAVGHPRPVSIMDPEAEDGWEFMGWIEVELP